VATSLSADNMHTQAPESSLADINVHVYQSADDSA